MTKCTHCDATVLSTSQPVGDYVLMPREATRAMTMAGCDMLPSCEHVFGHAGEMLRNAYQKMVEVAAASQPNRMGATAEGEIEPRTEALRVVSTLALGWLERCLSADPLSEPERFEIEWIIEALLSTSPPEQPAADQDSTT